MNHRAASPKTRGDNYLSIKDSGSLDTYIQNTLSSLYPPFEATAATVLWQLFTVVEKRYRGDGLRCLVDFLVPAKRALQSIQQETCGNYAGLIFYHEGWPLCVHEKVVIQLASLHKVRLKPGDFYFQVVPGGKQSANLVLKCLSGHGPGLEEVVIPETMYGYIFTVEFLEHVNYGRSDCPLESCLLTTGSATYRTPWKNIVNPVFVPTAETILQTYSNHSLLEKLLSSGPEAKAMTQTMESRSSPESSTSNDTSSTVIEVPLAENPGDQESNDAGPKKNAALHISETLAGNGDSDEDDRKPSLLPEVVEVPKDPEQTLHLSPVLGKENASTPSLAKRNGTKSITFGTDLSSPRQRGRDSLYFETKRLFRKSYIEALQNPMNLGSSSEESIAEETTSDQVMDLGETGRDSRVAESKTEGRNSACERQSKQEETRRTVGLEGPSQTSEKSLVLHNGFRLGSRRARSLDRTNKGSQSKDDNNPWVFSDGMDNASPPKPLNGHAVRLEKLDSHIHEITSRKSHKFSKEDEGLTRNARASFRNCETPIKTSTLLPHQENALLSTKAGEPARDVVQNQLLDVNQEWLQSGVVSLCGNRARCGRAVVQVCIKNSAAGLSDPSRVHELTHLLRYFYNILRKEVRALGLLILIDARKNQNVPVLFKALAALQTTVVPHSIHTALILADKDSAFKLDKEVAFQCEVVTSLKALHRFIDCSQLTAEFDGPFPYNPSDWIRFRRKLEPFVTNCKEAIRFLQCSVCSLTSAQTPRTAQEVNDLVNKHKTMMKLVLEDELLVTLRLEGGTVVARLRKEEFNTTEDYRDAMEMVTRLYNQVDEEVHRLVLLSNKSLQYLESILAMRKFEEGCDQIKTWLDNEREKYLAPLDQKQLSGKTLKQKQEEFQVFSEKATQLSQKGFQLLKANSALNSGEAFRAFRTYLNDLATQTEERRRELQKLVQLYEFYETAHQWMVDCNEYLEHHSVEAIDSPSTIQFLQRYHQESAKVSAANFHQVREVIVALGSKEEVKHWNILWLKCQETRHHLEEILSGVLKDAGRDSPCSTRKEIGQSISPTLGIESGTHQNHLSNLSSGSDDNIWANQSLFTFHDGNLPACESQVNTTQSMEEFPPINPSPSHTLTPLLGRFQRTSRVSQDLDNISTCYSEPIQTPTTRHRKHPLKKIMKKTQSFELARHESNPCELHHYGYTGVYIKGLEVANNVATEKKNTQRSKIKSPLAGRNRSLSSPSRIHHADDEDEKKGGGRLIFCQTICLTGSSQKFNPILEAELDALSKPSEPFQRSPMCMDVGGDTTMNAWSPFLRQHQCLSGDVPVRPLIPSAAIVYAFLLNRRLKRKARLMTAS